MNSEYEKSNTSYTNKDFQSLYEELLLLGKELSYKWDPTISNESDPLIVMLKELALTADKINYSSDKLALESMPLSATQEENARALYKLLDYYPKWYNACEQKIYLSWNKGTTDSEGARYDQDLTITIPRFTQIKDEDGNYTYTIIDPVTVKLNGEGAEVSALEGYIQQVKINNEITNIQINHLDEDNRLYLPDYAVAQNGIFVYYTQDEGVSDSQHASARWTQVDNLFAQELDNTFYSFDVDQRTKQCYLQFPEDIADIIKGGLSIYYIVTTGTEGTAPIGMLTEFSESSQEIQTSAAGKDDYLLAQKKVTLSSDSVYMTNTEVITVATDPEGIDQQYKNYKRIAGTFDTLVTLRDYCNALYNTANNLSGTMYAASNGYVCDRTNDIQSSYKVSQKTLDGFQKTRVCIDQVSTDSNTQEDIISPYGLKIYAYKYKTDTYDTKLKYDETFEPFESIDVEAQNFNFDICRLAEMLDENKCIQHNYKNLEYDKIAFIKNLYTVNCKIVTLSSTSALQLEQIKTNIRKALYEKFNSRQMEFGESVSYDDLETTILKADGRIQNVILSELDYGTYAIYFSSGGTIEITMPKGPNVAEKTITASEQSVYLPQGWRTVLVSNEVVGIADPYDQMLNSERDGARCLSEYINFGNSESIVIPDIDKEAFKENNQYYPIIIDRTKYIATDEAGATQENPAYGWTYLYNSQTGRYELYSFRSEEFRTEIAAKSVLAGVSQYIVQDDNKFNYQLGEKDTTYQNIISVLPSVDITFRFKDDGSGGKQAKYELKDGESILFSRPSLIEETQYGSYVRYYYKGSQIQAGADHELSGDDKLVLYYKLSETDNFYTTAVFKSGTIVCPSFTLSPTGDISDPGIAPASLPENIPMTNAQNTISIKSVNSKEYTDDAVNYCYVITETQRVSSYGSGKEYVMNISEKNPDTNRYEYVLGQDEYFVYTNEKKTFMVTYGSGTVISTLKQATFVNPMVDLVRISRFGLSALEDSWQQFGRDLNLTVTEQEFYTVTGNGSSVTLTTRLPIPNSTATLTREGIHFNTVDNTTDGGQGITNTDDNGVVRWFDTQVTQYYESDSGKNSEIEEGTDTSPHSGYNLPVLRDFVFNEKEYAGASDTTLNRAIQFVPKQEWNTVRLSINADNDLENCLYGFKFSGTTSVLDKEDIKLPGRETVYAVSESIEFNATSGFKADDYPVEGGIWPGTVGNDDSIAWQQKPLTKSEMAELLQSFVKVKYNQVFDDSIGIYKKNDDGSYQRVRDIWSSGQHKPDYPDYQDYYVPVKLPKAQSPATQGIFEWDDTNKTFIVSPDTSADEDKTYYYADSNAAEEFLGHYFTIMISSQSTSSINPSTGVISIQYQNGYEESDTNEYSSDIAIALKEWEYTDYQGQSKIIQDSDVRYCNLSNLGGEIEKSGNTISVKGFPEEKLNDVLYVVTPNLVGSSLYSATESQGNIVVNSCKITSYSLGAGASEGTYNFTLDIGNEEFQINGATLNIGLFRYAVENEAQGNSTAQPDSKQWTDVLYPTVNMVIGYIPDISNADLGIFDAVEYENPNASGEPVEIVSSGTKKVAWKAESFFALETSTTKTPKLEEGQSVTLQYIKDGVELEDKVEYEAPEYAEVTADEKGSPSANGWYILENGEYVLSTDHGKEPGEHYYKRTKEVETFINMSDEYAFGNNKKTSTISYEDNGAERYPSLNETKYDVIGKESQDRQDSTKYTSISIEPDKKVVYSYIDMSTVSEKDKSKINPKKSGWYVFKVSGVDTRYAGNTTGSPSAQGLCVKSGDNYMQTKDTEFEDGKFKKVTTPEGNPSEKHWYEKNTEGIFVLTTDASVQSGKDYYECDYYDAKKTEDITVAQGQSYYKKETKLEDEATEEKVISLGNLNLPSGDYILTVKQYCDMLSTCCLQKDGASIPPMNAKSSEDTDISNQQVYYFKLAGGVDNAYVKVQSTTGKYPSAEGWYEIVNEEYVLTQDTTPAAGKTYYKQSEYSIAYKWKDEVSVTERSKIDLEPVIKVKDGKGYYFNNKVRDKIAELDYKKVFNYAYQVPEDILIKDPLESQSFFDENHIFNQFVIPQMNTAIIRDVR